MDKDIAIDRLRALEPELRRAGVEALYLFGSTARGEARAGSDVDLFVDYDPSRFGLLDVVALRRRLGGTLGVEAHLTTRDGLHPRLRAGIEGAALRVF